MKKIILLYALALFALLSLFKSIEYLFFSYKISLDLYLGLTAFAFLLIGAFAASYLYRQKTSSSSPPPLPDAELLDKFSERELEVLNLLGHGYTNKEIAQMLELSPNTVKTHLNNLYSKLEVSNRTQAVAEARLLNLIH